MAIIFTDIVLTGFAILKFRYKAATKQNHSALAAEADPSRLMMCSRHLRVMYDYIGCLPTSAEFLHFSGPQIAQFIIVIVLGVRLSFPIDQECPGWDHASARKILDLGSFLDEFSSEGHDNASTNAKADVLAATKIIVGIVQRKYQKLLAGVEISAAMQSTAPPCPVSSDLDNSTLRKCPMFDGSLTEYLDAWDDTFITTGATGLGTYGTTDLGPEPGLGTNGSSASEQPGGTQPVIFHDLWATMTMGWPQDDYGGGGFPAV